MRQLESVSAIPAQRLPFRGPALVIGALLIAVIPLLQAAEDVAAPRAGDARERPARAADSSPPSIELTTPMVVAAVDPAEPGTTQAAGDRSAADQTKSEPPGTRPIVAGSVRAMQAVVEAKSYLSSEQSDEGWWGSKTSDSFRCGITGLCTLALLQSEVKSDDLRIRRAAEYLRGARPELTYEVALQTLALCAIDPKRDVALIQRNAKWLEETQIRGGTNDGSWSYGGQNRALAGDRSNAEFALWGLEAAARAGAQVDRGTWERALAHWLASQNPDGSWGYSGGPGGAGTGSMTASGIASVAICLAHLRDDADKPTDAEKQSLQQGLEWLGKRFTVGHNPGGGAWVFYYLVMLRRACEATGTDMLGTHRWREELSESLVRTRNAINGSWRGVGQLENDPLIATAFGILALTEGMPGKGQKREK